MRLSCAASHFSLFSSEIRDGTAPTQCCFLVADSKQCATFVDMSFKFSYINGTRFHRDMTAASVFPPAAAAAAGAGPAPTVVAVPAAPAPAPAAAAPEPAVAASVALDDE